MSTPLHISETRSLNVFTGIILNKHQSSERINEDFVRDFAGGLEYEIKEFEVDGYTNFAAIMPCRLIFNYYGPVMLVPPSGRAWLAELDHDGLSEEELIVEVFTRKGWYDFIAQSIGRKETFGSIENINRLKDGTLWSASMEVQTFKGRNTIHIGLVNPTTRKALKSLKEFDATMTNAAEDDSDSGWAVSRGLDELLGLWGVRSLTGKDHGPLNFEQFLEFLGKTKTGQSYHSKEYGKIYFDMMLENLKDISGEEYKKLETRYNQLVKEHKENFHKVLESIIEDLVEAAMDS